MYKNKLLLAQFGCFEFQVVVDCKTVDIRNYKKFLESKDRLFLFWNAKFDLKFFLHQRIIIKNVYDGYLAEKLMWLGYPPGYHELNLKAAGINYLGVELDKTIRGKIFYAGLATDVIVYSAHDVKYLEPIRQKQLEKAAENENGSYSLYDMYMNIEQSTVTPTYYTSGVVRNTSAPTNDNIILDINLDNHATQSNSRYYVELYYHL